MRRLQLTFLIFLIVIPCNGIPTKDNAVAYTNKSNNHRNQISEKKSYPKQVQDQTETIKAWVTAYSSTIDQTDSTPRITALGTKTRRGVVAANFLPLGTRIKIPEVFGEKIFIVEDRMHPRKRGHIDVWMPTRKAAKRFGKKHTSVVVLLENENDKNL